MNFQLNLTKISIALKPIVGKSNIVQWLMLVKTSIPFKETTSNPVAAIAFLSLVSALWPALVCPVEWRSYMRHFMTWTLQAIVFLPRETQIYIWKFCTWFTICWNNPLKFLEDTNPQVFFREVPLWYFRIDQPNTSAHHGDGIVNFPGAEGVLMRSWQFLSFWVLSYFHTQDYPTGWKCTQNLI